MQRNNFKVKRILVNPNSSLSLQSHDFRSEHWVVINGIATVENNGKIFELPKGESTFIPLKHKHRLINNTSKDLEIELTKQELDLLAFLVMNNGNIVTKNELLEEIWEILYPVEEDVNKVEVYIGYLRKKLKPFNLDDHIKTVRGFGYRWN